MSQSGITKNQKEKFLRQHAIVVWMCGLSGSGKSTIATLLEGELFKRNYLTQIFDGDIIRAGLNRDLGYSDADRKENLRRIAEASKLLVDCGIICINAFISPTIDSRKQAKAIIGKDNFIEVYINASLEVCEKRDVKGLYSKARKGLIKDFTGIGARFEIPPNPDVEIKTDELSVEKSVDKLLRYILPIIEFKN